MKIAERAEEAGYRRIGQSLFGLESFFRRQLWPARVALVAAGLAIAIVLGTLFLRYGLKLYEDWRQTRLLHEAASMLQQGRFSEATQTARELLAQHPNSLPALYVLAEAAEKQNLEKPFHGANKSCACAQKIRTISLISFPRHCVLESSILLERRSIRFPPVIVTGLRFTLLQAGWLAPKETLPNKKNNLPLP